MYAIVEDGGGQLILRAGDVVDIDLRDLPEGASNVTFDRVLMVAGESGEPRVGAPYVAGATVTAEIVEREVKGEKIDIVKYRRRKASKRKQGHRQRHVRVKVSAINA
jgi:large subunit ribosomal protein L21